MDANIFSVTLSFINYEIPYECVTLLPFPDADVKYILSGELYEHMMIEQQDVIGCLFLLPDDYSLERKERFVQYMLRFLCSLLENDIETQVRSHCRENCSIWRVLCTPSDGFLYHR